MRLARQRASSGRNVSAKEAMPHITQAKAYGEETQQMGEAGGFAAAAAGTSDGIKRKSYFRARRVPVVGRN